jgi:hypothetical protein
MLTRKKALEIANAGLERYRLGWKKHHRGVRDCLADEMCSYNKQWTKFAISGQLDFMIEKFIKFANDKPSNKGIRVQKHMEVFQFNNKPFTVTFERGDLLNKKL